MNKFIFALIVIASSLFPGCQPGPSVQFEAVDPLTKVFPESNYFAPMEAHADVARGEHASFQFVVRANADIENLKVDLDAPSKGESVLSDMKKGFVSFVKVGRASPDPSNDTYAPMSGYFPDPIVYEESRDVKFGNTQPLWVSVKIPVDCETGIYKGAVTISGDINGAAFSDSKDFEIEVFEPVIEKSSLWVTNWFFLDRLHY